MTINSEVIDVSVSLGAASVSRTGFGTPLICGAATFATNLIQRYTAEDDYANDSELTTDIKAMLAAIFAQTNPVTTVAVAKLVTDVKQLNNLLINAVGGAGEIFGVTINGNDYTYTSLGGDTPADVVDALKIAIDGGSDPVTTTDNGSDLDIEADVAGTPFTIVEVSTHTGDQTLSTTNANVSIKTQLDTLKQTDNDWYGILLESRTALQITRAVEWATLNPPKIVIWQSSDADLITSVSSDLGSTLKASNYTRSVGVYDADNSKKIDAAWAGLSLAANPDNASVWWPYKTLTGIVAVAKSTTAKANLDTKCVNYYDLLYGTGAVVYGTVSKADTFVDEVILADWFGVRLAENTAQFILTLANRGEKIPYTDEGFSRLTQLAQNLVNEGVRLDHIVAGSETLTVPSTDADSDNPVTSSDRTARILRYSVEFQLAGAVHKVRVTVNITT